MTKELIEEILNGVGLPYRYHHFEVEEAVELPFICWIVPGSENFAADGKVYFQTNNVNIELYTDFKDFELEEKIEAVLDQKEIYWEKTEVYIESERLYEVYYELVL